MVHRTHHGAVRQPYTVTLPPIPSTQLNSIQFNPIQSLFDDRVERGGEGRGGEGRRGACTMLQDQCVLSLRVRQTHIKACIKLSKNRNKKKKQNRKQNPLQIILF